MTTRRFPFAALLALALAAQEAAASPAAQPRKAPVRKRPAKPAATLLIEPQPVRQGSVLFVVIRSKTPAGRITCTFDGHSVPLHPYLDGLRAIAPIGARHAPGSFPLIVALGGGQEIKRTITVTAAVFDPAQAAAVPISKRTLPASPQVAADRRTLGDVLGRETPEQLWTGPFTLPPHDGRGFGAEQRGGDEGPAGVNVDGADVGYSDTLDYTLAANSPVFAVNAGIVVLKQDFVLGGTTVVVDHGQGVMSAYFHLGSSSISPGDPVTRRTVIGRVGETGLAAGPLLRLALYVHGTPVDPRIFENLPKDQQGIVKSPPPPKRKKRRAR